MLQQGLGCWKQERKPAPVPKLPCTRAQLLKRERIKVVSEQDSREMLVQIPSCAVAPSFPQEPQPSKEAQAGRGHFPVPCCSGMWADTPGACQGPQRVVWML